MRASEQLLQRIGCFAAAIVAPDPIERYVNRVDFLRVEVTLCCGA